jgi:hypothetical protein
MTAKFTPFNAGKRAQMFGMGWISSALGGKVELNNNGQAMVPTVMGSNTSQNYEVGIAGVAATELDLVQPCRTMMVRPTIDSYIAFSAAAVATPGTGTGSDRWFVRANERIEIPAEKATTVFVQAVNHGDAGIPGTLYVEALS